MLVKTHNIYKFVMSIYKKQLQALFFCYCILLLWLCSYVILFCSCDFVLMLLYLVVVTLFFCYCILLLWLCSYVEHLFNTWTVKGKISRYQFAVIDILLFSIFCCFRYSVWIWFLILHHFLSDLNNKNGFRFRFRNCLFQCKSDLQQIKISYQWWITYL